MSSLIKSVVIDDASFELLPLDASPKRSPVAALEGELKQSGRHQAQTEGVSSRGVGRPGGDPLGQNAATVPAVGAKEMDVRQAQLEAIEKRLRSEMEERFKEAEATGYRKGFEKGLQEGHAKGEASAQEAYAQGVRELGKVFASALGGVDTLLAESEDLVAAITFETVCKLLGRRLLSPEACSAAVAETLAGFRAEDILEIRLNKEDCAELLRMEQAPEGLDGFDPKLAGLLVPDDSVVRGGCLLRLIGGGVDARIETRLRLFVDDLKKNLGRPAR